ncbi:transposase [Colletotrichum tabaci]|uniref:Transposase n=1 Tax=Colletotrichum tabaci TaxID=1209068 RepID=A0AAV9TJV9_9PEZI
MADRLLRDRGARRVGTNWASNFVRRRPELQTRFNRRIDYQRVLCEDPDAYRAWFSLVRNTIAKYGIDDTDIYNFDETGFAMGKMSSEMVVTASERRGKPRGAQQGNQEWVTVIQGIGSCGYSIPPYIIFAGKVHLDSWTCNSPLPPDWVITLTENGWTTNEKGLEWVQHFDFHTRSRTKGAYRLLILDGHESHHSVDFELYCKEQNIITLCMPPHSSHKLQPLDVGCFSPLKRAYSQEIEVLMRVHITHIAKEDFLPAFYKAYDKAMTTSNIQAGFRATGLVPYDPEHVISQLDVKLHVSSRGVPKPSGPDAYQVTAEAFHDRGTLNQTLASWQTLSHGFVRATPYDGSGAQKPFAGGLFEIAAFHQIHCLKSILEDFGLLAAGVPKNQLPGYSSGVTLTWEEHKAHCFNYVRQALMCFADSTAEGHMDKDPHRVADRGVMHVCNDFDSLLAWSRQPERALPSDWRITD